MVVSARWPEGQRFSIPKRLSHFRAVIPTMAQTQCFWRHDRCKSRSTPGNKSACGSHAGTRQLVMSCCAFGNSLTLPLVFLLALLPAAAADRATGYLALFMMGWSPMLWSFGLQLLGRSMPPTQPGVLLFCCVKGRQPVLWSSDLQLACAFQLTISWLVHASCSARCALVLLCQASSLCCASLACN